ncbi:MAG: ribosome-associated translation inhibitor RaiA [Gemmatimonadota bacterium]
MQVIISGRHTTVSPGLRQYIEEHFSKLSRYEKDLVRVEVTLLEERARFLAEAELSVRKAGPVHAEAEGPEARSALDRLHAKLRRQLRKSRSRRREHQGPSKEVHAPTEPEPSDE